MATLGAQLHSMCAPSVKQEESLFPLFAPIFHGIEQLPRKMSKAACPFKG
jgi:hypothetical protein